MPSTPATVPHHKQRRPGSVDGQILVRNAYYQAVMADSPYAYWRLGEASGTTAVDSSGNGRDGTYTGTINYGIAGAVTSDTNTAISFGTSTSRVDIPSVTFAGDFTIEFLVNRVTAGLSNATTVISGTTGGAPNYNFFSAVGRLYNGSGDMIVDNGSLNNNTWTHHILTRSGSSIVLYRDGRYAATGSGTTSLTFNTLGYGWLGYLDEVVLYTSALTPARVAAHYAALVY